MAEIIQSPRITLFEKKKTTTLCRSTCKPPALHSPDETGDIDVCECGHQVLTVKPIHDAAVAGDSAGEVLQKRRGER